MIIQRQFEIIALCRLYLPTKLALERKDYKNNIIRAANNHPIFRAYSESDLHTIISLRNFLAICINVSFWALFQKMPSAL